MNAQKRSSKSSHVLPGPTFRGVVTKRTKRAIRDEIKAAAKFNKRLDAAQRRRRKAYEERKRKRQEQSEFGVGDDGWVDLPEEYTPLQRKTMTELLNEYRTNLQPTEVVQIFKQSNRGITEKLNRDARRSSRQKYHSKIKDEYKKHSSQQPIPPVGSNGILLIDFDEMRYEAIQGTKATPTILHLIRRGYWSHTCHRPGVAFSIRMIAAYHCQVVSGVTSAESFVRGFGVRLKEKYLVNQLPKLTQPFRDAYNHWVSIDQECKLDFEKSVFCSEQGFGDPANLCPACFAPDMSEAEPLGYLSVDGNFQLKRRIRASDGEEEAPTSMRLFNCTASALGYTLGRPSDSCARNFNAMKETIDRRVFDERGILGAVCRHGHVIRFRNLYTTGEPANEIAWLLKGIQEHNPGVKRLALTYDVACAMDKALKTFASNEGMTLHTAVNRFHLHAHEYSCQVVYNPMLQPTVFGMTDGESIETAWSSNSHLVRLTRTAGRNARMQLLQSHAVHHAAQAKLRQGTRLYARYLDMSQKLIQLRHRLQLTGYREDTITAALAAEKAYFLSKPGSESQEYLELFENIQAIADIEAKWDTLRQRFHDGETIGLTDMRDFVENENLRMTLIEKRRNLIDKFRVRQADWEPNGVEYLKYLRFKCGRKLREQRQKIEKVLVEGLLKNREIHQRSTSVGTKKSKAIVAKLVQNFPALEKAVTKYNAILDDPEFDSLELKPPRIDIDIIKDARYDDELTGFKSLRHVWGLFREIGEPIGDIPEWISSERLRDAMVSFVAIQAVNGELKILKREMGRIISYAKARVETMMDCERDQSSATFLRCFFFEYQVLRNAVSGSERIIPITREIPVLLQRAHEYLARLLSARSSHEDEDVSVDDEMPMTTGSNAESLGSSELEDPYNDDLPSYGIGSDEEEDLSETEIAETIDVVDDELEETESDKQ
ncbi:hypothetical protein V1525DRAFT_386013 [Lipomyces kononenkoae]|uniref:Uncharacterized protein n=1 Tax=Lipomyces kononenkoae TaxID=34357 RepID=A0ACC3T8W4_LIPKO